MYTQCEIRYRTGSTEVCWIPSEFAKRNRSIIVGKHKEDGVDAVVVNVYGKTDRDMGLHREDYRHARERTDI